LLGIVDHDRELIGELAVGAQQHEVPDAALQRLALRALHPIAIDDLFGARSQSQGARLPSRRQAPAAGARKDMPAVDREPERRIGHLAPRARAPVGARAQVLERAQVERRAAALVDDFAVPGETKPLERVQDLRRRARQVARRVEILDAHQPAAARRARVEPARERGNERPEMQRTGGRGREPADVHGVYRVHCPLFSARRKDRTAVATVELTKDNFESTVNENSIVIVDFWAPWCGPCRGFAPVFEKASETHADVVFAKVNTDEQQELAGAFDIRSIPTLMVFREKVILFQQPGALPGSALEQVITQAKSIDMAKVHAEVAEHKGAQK